VAIKVIQYHEVDYAIVLVIKTLLMIKTYIYSTIGIL